jgi:parallel beta-helix repeat protein
MKKGFVIICILMISVLGVGFVSANWLTDLFTIGDESELEGRLASIQEENICECSSCGECTEMLNNENCLDVRLTKDIVLETKTHCIVNPDGFNDKIFDCQGHRIQGVNAGSGIHLKQKSGVVIKNCEISSFNKGIYLYHVDNVIIGKNKFKDNVVQGIRIVKGSGTIGENIISGGSYGLQMSLSGVVSGYTVLENEISGAAAYGVWVAYGEDNVITKNRVCGNGKWDLWANNPAKTDNSFSDNVCDSEKSAGGLCELSCEEVPEPIPEPDPISICETIDAREGFFSRDTDHVDEGAFCGACNKIENSCCGRDLIRGVVFCSCSPGYGWSGDEQSLEGECLKQGPELICEDSDGGEKYFVKGKTSAPFYYPDKTWGIQVVDDVCINSLDLQEQICNENGAHEPILYRCPGKCEDGACVCSDSDGGLDYFNKGLVISRAGDESVEDFCEGDFLLEGTCDEQGGKAYSYQCPSGCEDGACVCDLRRFVRQDEFEYYEVNGKDYGIYLEFIEDEKAGFVVNDEKLPLLSVGQSTKLLDGTIFTLLEIYFSSYEGGKNEASFCINVPKVSMPGSCSELVEVIGDSTNDGKILQIEETGWAVRNPHVDEYHDLKKYRMRLRAQRYGEYYYSWVNVFEVNEGEVGEINYQLNSVVERELCEVEKIEEGNNTQQIYLCQSPWSFGSDEKEIDSEYLSRSLTAYWIKGNLLFEVDLTSHYNDQCWDEESCARNQRYRLERNQEDIIQFLEKIVDNDQRDYVPLYLNGPLKDLITWMVGLCNSEIELTEAESSWSSWSCKLDPAICPPHGSQTQTCTKYNYNTYKEETRTNELQCNPGICSGCTVPRWFHESKDYSGGMDNICLPYGARFQKNNGWTIKEVKREINTTDSDGLSVRQANSPNDDELYLVVFENETALFNWNILNKTILLEIGKVFELPAEFWGDEVKVTMTVDDIYYDYEDYESSYFLATFHAVGEYTDTERIPDYINLYCGYDGKINQQKTKHASGAWASCQENFECDSNLCSGGDCIEINDLLGEISGMKSLGIRILCNFADIFRVQTYEECVLDNLGEE